MAESSTVGSSPFALRINSGNVAIYSTLRAPRLGFAPSIRTADDHLGPERVSAGPFVVHFRLTYFSAFAVPNTFTNGSKPAGIECCSAAGKVAAKSLIAPVKSGSRLENEISTVPARTRALFRTKKSTNPDLAFDRTNRCIAPVKTNGVKNLAIIQIRLARRDCRITSQYSSLISIAMDLNP